MHPGWWRASPAWAAESEPAGSDCHDGGVSEPTTEAGAHPRVRTFHARHGRLSDRARSRIVELGEQYAPSRRDPGRPVVLEIGCGAGDAALAFADAHPDSHLVAVDVHPPGVARLLARLEAAPRSNISVVQGDALELLDAELAGVALAGVHAFFPDPWPKARHRKRRLVRADVLDLLADAMAPGAVLRLATDVADYAVHAADVLEHHGRFTLISTERPVWRPTAGYEARGLAAGRTIHELAAERVPRT